MTPNETRSVRVKTLAKLRERERTRVKGIPKLIIREGACGDEPRNS